VLGLVRLTGATRLHHLKRKDQAGHVEYWKAQCGESRMLRLGGGKERKLLPIRTKGLAIVPRRPPTLLRISVQKSGSKQVLQETFTSPTDA
jgi:hypothetical protein